MAAATMMPVGIDATALPLPIAKPTISSAVEQVLNTTELLECILLHFGQLEDDSWTRLFPAQRVSRRFQDVIAASPALRRTMFLDSPLRTPIVPAYPRKLDGYRAFFGAMSTVLKPFWCHIRPSSGPGDYILAMNVSLFWAEETPGKMVGRAPAMRHSIERDLSWRKLRVPYAPEQELEFQVCGYPVDGQLPVGVTLGEIADMAVSAGKGHFGNMEPVIYHTS